MKRSKEVAELLGIVRSTLFNYTKECGISGSLIDKRVYYNDDEIALLKKIHNLRQQKKTWYEVKEALDIKNDIETEQELFESDLEEDKVSTGAEIVLFKSEIIQALSETTDRFLQLSDVVYKLGKAEGQISELKTNNLKSLETIEEQNETIKSQNHIIDNLKTSLNQSQNQIQELKNNLEKNNLSNQYEVEKRDLLIKELTEKLNNKDNEIDLLQKEINQLKNRSWFKKIIN